ncbi:MAG: dihydroneopterin aldolase [Firmicutes bacterium]|nr:dihydroneopterin aldolase [Bacillota bacterium]
MGLESSDRISLQGMVFFGTHGVYEEEARLGQRFEVDVDLYVDTDRAGRSDQLEDAINYGDVYHHVRSVVQGQRFQLIEALAAAVARTLLTEYPALEAVTVRVRKPHAPIDGVLDTVEIEIHRRRAWLAATE